MPKLQEREDEDQRERKEFDLGFDEPETPLPLTVTSRVCVFFFRPSSWFGFCLMCLICWLGKLDIWMEKMRFVEWLNLIQVLYMLGDLTAGPAYRFTQWLELVRKRTSQYRSSGFPHRPPSLSLAMPLRYFLFPIPYY